MSNQIVFGEEEEKSEMPAHKEPPRTQPLETLHKDIYPNVNDTEMDVLLPYFIDDDLKKKRKMKKKKNEEEEK